MKQFKSIKPVVKEEKGLIAIVAQEQSRYTKFWTSFSKVCAKMPNVGILWHVGNQLCKARNDAIQNAIKLNADWLWFIDDDHWFEGDIINRLLVHNVDLVGPLYCIRGYPFDPTARTLGDDKYEIINIPESGPPKLIEVGAIGTSGMLIRRKVWETVPYPWFTVGHIHADQMAEDFSFCERVKKAGLKIHLDTATPLDHFMTAAVSIQYTNDKWCVVMDLGQNYKLALPYVIAKEDDES
jgi:hypothetical protein